MEKTGFRDRRRKYLIEKDFQAKFVLRVCVPIILTAFISAFIVYHFSSQSTTTVFEHSRLIIKPTTEFIKPALILGGFISIILVGIATIVIMFFQSHRIAGPLYKLESSLEKIADGDLSFDIHFRKGDEVKRLAEVFNMASKSLGSMIMGLKDESAELNSALAKMKEQGADVNNEIKKIEKSAANLNEKLNNFKLR